MGVCVCGLVVGWPFDVWFCGGVWYLALWVALWWCVLIVWVSVNSVVVSCLLRGFYCVFHELFVIVVLLWDLLFGVWCCG